MPLPLDDMVVIVGAGISFDAPTRAVGFGEIRRKFLKRCKIDPGILPPDELSPEQIFEALDDHDEVTRETIQRDLWHLCEAGEPNLNHHAVAALIRGGAKVWTPNFDNMIERTFEDPNAIESVVDEPSRARPGPILMKPHGSFPQEPNHREPRRHDYRLLFQTSAVWNLDVAWRNQLEADCACRDVFLFGYRGADPDLTPAILLALAGARTATWWECDTENLPRLEDFTRKTRIEIRKGNPSVALRELACSKVGFTEKSVPLDRRPAPGGGDYELRYRPSYESRAGIAGLVEGSGKARKLRLKGMLDPRVTGDRRQMAYKLVRSAGYDWAVAKPPLRLALSHALRRPGLSSEQRTFLAANYLMLIDSAPVRKADEPVIADLRRTGVCGTPAVDVRLASIAKRRGDLRQAREDAERALAGTGNDALLEAMVVYNLAWIYRQMGDFAARDGLLRGYMDRRAHIGPNWAAWLAIDNALLALQFGDTDAAGAEMDSPLAVFSRKTVNHPAYLQDDEIARALITWHKGDADGAAYRLEESLAKRPTGRLRPAFFSSLATQILLADGARIRGDRRLMDSWLHRAGQRTHSSLQQAQIALVRAYTQTNRGDLKQIEREARQRGFGLVAATAAAGLGGEAEAVKGLDVDPSLPLPALY